MAMVGHPPAVRAKAAMIYAMTGNCTDVEKQIGVPQATVKHWLKNSAEFKNHSGDR
jgi:hypothetical protein